MWFPAPTVGLLLLQFVAAATEQTALNGWYQCSDFTFSDAGSSTGQNAECAIYNAPLCHSGICETSASVDSTIEIFVKCLPASKDIPDVASNVWLLQGGPGYSSTTLESTMKELHTQLEGMVNVYTMDHRGTGRSTRLDCVASQITTTGSPSGTTINQSEVAACAKDLEYKYGNLSSFSMTSAATDIAMFISKYTNGKNTIVYGVSYGTASVERLMHLAPATVTGYVLDGIATTPGTSSDKFPYISLWDTDFGEVGEAFLGLCKQDKACTAHFTSGNPAATLERVINNFDKDPNSTCSQLMTSVSAGQKNESPSFALRRALGLLLPDSTLRALIPPVIYRLNRCAPDDISVLAQFITSLNALAQTKTQDEAYKSMLLYYLIVFSETWETPTPSNLVMETRFVDVKSRTADSTKMVGEALTS